MVQKTPITVAYGDGIGPEIMAATLRVLEAAGAQLDIETIDIGEKVYLAGNTAGISEESWESLLRTRVFLKAPITTPFGGGYKSLNVTARKTLGLFANVRPCVAYDPYVFTRFPNMDVVIIRENEEDLYAGIEYRQTNQVYQCLKLISEPGSEKIIRYAFEYARNNRRKKVTCFVKDNIMKLTDGVFHRIFDKIAREYPEIQADSIIIDIGAARLADSPEMFDVIVTLNLYGDILSDIAAQISGSVGIGGSSNIGDQGAMFEAIHGSAPTIAGKDIANPSGLLLSAVMMLVHINQPKVASLIQNAWLRTIEEGIHTADIYKDGLSKKLVGTREFTDELIKRLGKNPEKMPVVKFADNINRINPSEWQLSYSVEKKKLMGVDVFLDWKKGSANELGEAISALLEPGLKLNGISNRGVQVWPNGRPETFCSDHWRCRFEAEDKEAGVTHTTLLKLLQRFETAGYDFVKTENLYYFDNQPGYSMSQGQ
jgi:isocitrate dehydrogenase